MAETANTTSKPTEFEPPAACISRIIKQSLPENIQITKEARAAFARAAGIFIFYLTHCANDYCRDSKRQTIYTADVINALKELDFEEFVGPLEDFLAAYQKENETKKTIPKEKKSAESGAIKAADEGDAEEDEGGNIDEDGDMEEEEDAGDNDS